MTDIERTLLLGLASRLQDRSQDAHLEMERTDEKYPLYSASMRGEGTAYHAASVELAEMVRNLYRPTETDQSPIQENVS